MGPGLGAWPGAGPLDDVRQHHLLEQEPDENVCRHAYKHACRRAFGMCYAPLESSRRGGQFEHRHDFTGAVDMPSATPMSSHEAGPFDDVRQLRRLVDDHLLEQETDHDVDQHERRQHVVSENAISRMP